MSHNTFKISKYDLSKKSEYELKHYIQLIEIDITNYDITCANYPNERMEKCGKPHQDRLKTVLETVTNELDRKENE